MGTSKGLPGLAGWAPPLLRLAIGVTFVWAGLGKLLATAELPASTRPLLVEMGAVSANRPDSSMDQRSSGEAVGGDEGGGEGDGPAPGSGATGPGASAGRDSTALPKADAEALSPRDAGETPVKPLTEPEAVAPTPVAQARATPKAEVPRGEEGFDESSTVRVRRVWGLGVRVHASAHPVASENQANPLAIWPVWIGSPGWSAFWAWSVVAAEVVFGLLLLVGLLSRVSGVALAGVMLGAVWLDQIGPALQSGDTRLGFLPNHDFFDVRAWMPMLWQVSLLCGTLSIVLLGGGRLSVDRLLFGTNSGDDDEL